MSKKGFFDKKGLQLVGINLVLVAVVSGGLLFGLILWLKNYTQHGVEIEVSDVRGMLVNDAEPLLTAQGLRMIVVDSTYSDKFPLGTIVDQDPQPMSHAKNGRMVYVTINATTRRLVTMPNLQDMSYRQAQTTLRSMGLNVDSVFEYRPSAYRDLVLEIKSGGVPVVPGEKLEVGTRVRLVVGYGRGENKVEVPNVVGLTLQEARSLLLSHRLTIGAVQYDEKEKEGEVQYVYQQTPLSGEQLLEGETVALRLSANKEKAVHAVQTGDEEDNWF